MEKKTWYTVIWTTVANNTGTVIGAHMGHVQSTPEKMMKAIEEFIKEPGLVTARLEFVFEGKCKNLVSHAI